MYHIYSAIGCRIFYSIKKSRSIKKTGLDFGDCFEEENLSFEEKSLSTYQITHD